MNFIPVHEPLLDGREKELLIECIETGWISSEGTAVKQFELRMADLTRRRFALAVSNGSTALDIAVKSLGLAKGSEVILPSFTIISCAAAIVRAGLVPVVVDCDPVTWNITADHVRQAITPKTGAIMAVHIYGLPVEMREMEALAREYGLKIVEDAAEAIGLECAGKPCGSFGDVSAFSFYANKLVTTGEGGMILTDDESIAERCSSLRNLCHMPGKRFHHEELGVNGRMGNLQAAVGCAQLERLEEFAQRRREIGAAYNDLFKDVAGVTLPCPATGYADNIYWVYGLVLDDEVPMDAEQMMAALREKGIGTRPFFWPVHEQPVFQKMGLFKNVSYPVSERLARRGLYIPSSLSLGKTELERVADSVKQILAEA
ncbi:MAG: DegT/DnrJ/EryC1/StrS family aminotransferase [Desulfovibrio sp.]|uniref:DegT/DnrJ/EryC1/StrS family aminotransferase n=1 Tax=Desulfovibrio sp. 7SRBS1 TaxID=3378064 RepID=UPI003B3FFAA2